MSDYRVKFALEPWELAGAAALRRQVFCDEQGIFTGDDRDAIDSHAIPIIAVPEGYEEVIGTVRIHEAEPGTWWGSRLCVAPDYRRVGSLGASLIRLAVSSAHARGCTRFLAHVQSRNAILFRRLHWRSIEEVSLHGRPHHFMEASLAHYPPDAAGEVGFLTMDRRAA